MTNLPEITTELEEAVKAYLLAKVYAQAIEPDVIDYKTKILAENNFRNKWYGIDGRRSQITGSNEFVRDPKDVHRILDEDWPIYLQCLEEAQRAHGFNAPEGQCPLLTAQSNLFDAERLVVKESSCLTGSDNEVVLNSYNKTKEFADLTASFVLAQRPNISTESVMALVK